MASEVDIVNLALAHLGDEAQVISIVPPDGTTQAAHGGRFYPIARDQLLAMHPWTFATTRLDLAEFAAAPPAAWTYAYALPTKCLRPLTLLAPDGLDDSGSEDFIVETDDEGKKVLFTNVEQSVLRFVRLVEDPTKFTPGFVTSLARLLASMMAGPILKGTTGMQVAGAHLKIFELELASAKALDSNTGRRHSYRDNVSTLQRARGLVRTDNWRLR